MNYESLKLEQLTRIADSLERITNVVEGQFGKDIDTTQRKLSNEEELFLLLTKVYKDAEKQKRELGLKRKPPRTVSKKINFEVEVFLEDKLNEEYTVTSDKGMQLIKKDGKIVGVLKIYTDLGRPGRGSLWYQTIQNVVNEVNKEYGVPASRVFFLVSSMNNGLDNQHVLNVLGKNISNSDLLSLEYRRELEHFLYEYVDGATSLPNPHEQIYFLSADNHPNIMGSECVDHGERVLENLKRYNWLQPSITELINYINEKC